MNPLQISQNKENVGLPRFLDVDTGHTGLVDRSSAMVAQLSPGPLSCLNNTKLFFFSFFFETTEHAIIMIQIC